MLSPEERTGPGFRGAPPKWGHTPEDVCPGYLISLPQVIEAAMAHRWFDKGQLGERLQAQGVELTPLLQGCIDALDGAIGEVESDMMRDMSK